MTARGCVGHLRAPLKRSTGRPSRQPVEPELQKETDGRIDRSEVRDTPWDPLARKGRWFVWNSRRGNHLGQRSTKPHQQAGHMDASDPIRPSKTLAARGPSTYGSRLKAGTTMPRALDLSVQRLQFLQDRLALLGGVGRFWALGLDARGPQAARQPRRDCGIDLV